MFRPTPGRLLYLLIGLVIGAVVLFAYSSVAGLPTTLSFLKSPATPTTAKAPTVFSGATLNKVLLANQSATKGTAQLRINGVEEYADGFGVTYSILSGQPGEPAPVLQPERFDVVDDNGVSYALSPVGSASTVSPGLSTGYLAFTPALSPDAKQLTVSVPHVLVVSGVADSAAPRVLDGPWQVQIPLR
jgi:hypothetical protein